MSYRTTSLAIAILGLITNAAAAQSYVFHELYTLGSTQGPGFDGFPNGVGPGGEVVGQFTGDRPPGTGGYPTIWNTENPNGIYLESIDTYANVYATDGVNQVGAIGETVNGIPYDRATMWSGQPGTATNLNPTPVVEGVPVPWIDSFALAVSTSQQVGYGCPNGCFNGNPHYALLWSGTQESFVNLNPAGFNHTFALGVQGGQQVGVGDKTGFSGYHAMLWTGSADSAVDLNPQGYGGSVAYATDGHQQVGSANNGGASNAIVWTGTAESAVDLGPGTAIAVADGKQVGLSGTFNGGTDVTVWSGSADSALDLNPLLPYTYSVHGPGGNVTDPIKDLYIDSSGDIFGVAIDSTTSLYHAFELQAVAPNGDYNYDGVVDMRDYVVWRDGFGTKYDIADYQAWRANFGRTIASGSAFSAVPEPGNWQLLVLLAILIVAFQQRRMVIVRTF